MFRCLKSSTLAGKDIFAKNTRIMERIKIADIIEALEAHAPLMLQESYDNAGLICGDRQDTVEKVLITIDITRDVLEEAKTRRCGLIISHHPLIFKPLKNLTGINEVQRLVIDAIRHRISLYAVHTNLDNVHQGVSFALAEKLGLTRLRVLKPAEGMLRKLVTFCPKDHAERVRQAIFDAGAGHIGNYDCCSFNVSGQGSFRGGEGSNPFTGKAGQLHVEDEIRIETIFPAWLESSLLSAMKAAHPYEEVAYDIYPLENKHQRAGSGMIGALKEPMEETTFLAMVKETAGSGVIRYTGIRNRPVKKVAVCGGAGAFLIRQAIQSGADAYITGDLKYHDFFETEGRLLLADIGHYESEQFAKALIYSIISQKFPNFAALISDYSTNPVNCL